MNNSLYEVIFDYFDKLSFFYGVDIEVTLDLIDKVIDLDKYIKNVIKEVLEDVQ